MIRRSRSRLLLVGLLMIASLVLVGMVPYAWVPAVILVPSGAYLIVWATHGRGYWCRACKGFSASSEHSPRSV
jgi:hypothetical protein